MMTLCPTAKNLYYKWNQVDTGAINQVLQEDLISSTCIKVLCSGATCHHDWTLYFTISKVLI